jgi:hypothetical protein
MRSGGDGGHARRDRRAGADLRLDLQRAGQAFDPLAHGGQPEASAGLGPAGRRGPGQGHGQLAVRGDAVPAGPVRRRIEPDTVVADVKGDLVLHVGQGQADPARVGMLGHVGQRLLRGPQQRHLDLRAHRPGVPRGGDLRVDTAAA